VPNTTALIGTAVYVQGAIVDAGVGLATGLAAVVQP
jgi:hypothetical protein